MTKMKEGWESLPRASKLAACLWPSLVPDNIKAEMRTIPYGVGEPDPLAARTGNVRSGNRVVRNYDNVPGLRRKQRSE
jgi:hypothetical protein